MASASNKDKAPAITSGMPPWHAGLFIGALLGISVVSLPEDLDDLGTIGTFTRRVFPELMSLKALAIIRLVIAVSCWLVTFHMLFIAQGWTIATTYKPQSKLRNTSFQIVGIQSLCPFTSWCWIMLASSFSLSGYIALMSHLGKAQEVETWMLRSALVLWEISGPFTLLVSAVVRYAIWPAVLAAKRPHKLNSFRNQMQHNMNTVFALSEMALLGGLPVEFAHISLPCFVGVIYILFTWLNCYFYATLEWGPQYIYWFMDPTLGKATTIALAALVITLVLSFVTFYCIEMFVKWTGPSLFMHIMSVVIVSSAVVKTR